MRRLDYRLTLLRLAQGKLLEVVNFGHEIGRDVLHGIIPFLDFVFNKDTLVGHIAVQQRDGLVALLLLHLVSFGLLLVDVLGRTFDIVIPRSKVFFRYLHIVGVVVHLNCMSMLRS